MSDQDKQLRISGASAIGIMLVCILAFLLQGCRTTKQSGSPPIVVATSETATDTKHVHIERIDTVFVTIPAQSAEKTTTEGFSHLETEYAESDARINADGSLFHSLTNKTDPKPVPVKNTTDTIYVDRWQSVDKPYPVEVPKEIERKLTRWEKVRLDTWAWLATALILGIGWRFRKQILTFLRRIIIKRPS